MWIFAWSSEWSNQRKVAKSDLDGWILMIRPMGCWSPKACHLKPKGNGKMPSSPKTPIQTTLAKYRIKLTSHHIFDKLVIPWHLPTRLKSRWYSWWNPTHQAWPWPHGRTSKAGLDEVIRKIHTLHDFDPSTGDGFVFPGFWGWANGENWAGKWEIWEIYYHDR